jgi:hypothetical protein
MPIALRVSSASRELRWRGERLELQTGELNMVKKAVIGLLKSEARAECVVSELRIAGFSTHDVSVLFSDVSGTRDLAHEQQTRAAEVVGAGAGGAGVMGGTLGLLAGIGAVAIPGLGPFIASGPIMAALSGVATGATIGGLGGTLIGLGLPEVEAKRYAGKLKQGNILLCVHADDYEQANRARKILDLGGAEDVTTTGETRVPWRDRPPASLSWR